MYTMCTMCTLKINLFQISTTMAHVNVIFQDKRASLFALDGPSQFCYNATVCAMLRLQTRLVHKYYINLHFYPISLSASLTIAINSRCLTKLPKTHKT